MGSPSRNVQYHPPRLSEDRLNLPQPHSPSLPTHCSGKSGMRPIGDNPSIERTLGYSSTLYFIMKPHGLAEFRIPWVQAGKRPNGEPYDALLWALEEAAKKAGAMVTVREVHRLSETNAPPKRQVDRDLRSASDTATRGPHSMHARRCFARQSPRRWRRHAWAPPLDPSRARPDLDGGARLRRTSGVVPGGRGARRCRRRGSDQSG